MADEQSKTDVTSVDIESHFRLIDPVFFNIENQEEFWNEQKMHAYARNSTGGYPSYPFVDAAKQIITENINLWIMGMNDEQRIAFFTSDDFLTFIKETARYDFQGKISKYIEDVDKGWIVRHIAIYLAETYLFIPVGDPRKLALIPRIQEVSRIIIGLWSYQYKRIGSIVLDWYKITDENSNLDIEKATELINVVFKEKTLNIVRSLFNSVTEQ